jgi:hypothetical protein
MESGSYIVKKILYTILVLCSLAIAQEGYNLDDNMYLFGGPDSMQLVFPKGDTLVFPDSGAVLFTHSIDTTTAATDSFFIPNLWAFLDSTRQGLFFANMLDVLLSEEHFYYSSDSTEWYVRQSGLNGDSLKALFVSDKLTDDHINESTLELNDLGEKNFASLANKPTTLSGYGITDALLRTAFDDSFDVHIANNDQNWKTTGSIAGDYFAVLDSAGALLAMVNYVEATEDYTIVGNSGRRLVLKGGNTTEAVDIDNGITNINQLTLDTDLANQYLDGDLEAIGNLAGTAGLARKTAANTWTLDTNTYLTASSIVLSDSEAVLEGFLDHDDLQGFVGNEHIDWTTDQGATNIHANNYVEVDGSITNEIEVVDEAYSSANFNGGTTSAVSQDDFYDYQHIADTDDDGKVNIVDVSTAGFLKSDAVGGLSVDTNTYLTGNQSITLSGDVTGSGTTAITTTIADNSVDGTDIALGSDAQGDIMYYNGTDWARLGQSTSGYVLKTQGAGANPAWTNITGYESALEGVLDHDDLQGFVANEHIDWTSTSSNFNTSGTGQFGGALTLGGQTYLGNARYLYGRNAANTANIRLFGLNQYDQFYFGQATGIDSIVFAIGGGFGMVINSSKNVQFYGNLTTNGDFTADEIIGSTSWKATDIGADYLNIKSTSGLYSDGNYLNMRLNSNDLQWELSGYYQLALKDNGVDWAELSTAVQDSISDGKADVDDITRYVTQWIDLKSLYLDGTYDPSWTEFNSQEAIATLQFAGVVSAGSEEEGQFTFTLPTNYKSGTDFYFYVSYFPTGTTTDDVQFQFDYKTCNVGASYSTNTSKTVVITSSMTNLYRYVSGTAACSGTGLIPGSEIYTVFSRQPNSPNDTYSSDMYVTKLGIRYQIEGIGDVSP